VLEADGVTVAHYLNTRTGNASALHPNQRAANAAARAAREELERGAAAERERLLEAYAVTAERAEAAAEAAAERAYAARVTALRHTGPGWSGRLGSQATEH
jgi:hypothetical protein